MQNLKRFYGKFDKYECDEFCMLEDIFLNINLEYISIETNND